MRLVARGIDQRDWPTASRFADLLDQFREVAPTKLRPALGPVSEPTPQLGARRDVPEPAVNRRVGLLDAARPQPIDQDASAVAEIGPLVSPLQFDFAGLPGHRHTPRFTSLLDVGAPPAWRCRRRAALALGKAHIGRERTGSADLLCGRRRRTRDASVRMNDR